MKLNKIRVDSSYFSAIGGRDYQEDRYVLSTGNYGWLLAIMDGHAGDQTAIYCHQNLIEAFRKTNSLIGAIKLLHKKTKTFESGCTISAVHIPPDAKIAHVAVLGDSPVIIKMEDNNINVGPEHNARTNLVDRQKATSKGAYYSDGYIWLRDYGMQLTRSLGDRMFRKVYNDEPEVFWVKLGKESFVIVASDGVIDPGHGDSKTQIDRMVKLVENGADAKKLVEDALARETKDNATAIVWRKIK